MSSKPQLAALAACVSALALAGQAGAATFDLSLTGNVADFSLSTFTSGSIFVDAYALPLSGLPEDGVTVSQGDVVNTTVTLDQAYTIASAPVRTHILQFLFGDFTPTDTGVDGTFQFFNGAALVASFDYSSTTSGALSSFAAVFPPDNGAFTFDSYTNNFSVTTLAGPSTIQSAEFDYQLLANVVPEPEAWALMILGFGLSGAAMRRRRSLAA